MAAARHTDHATPNPRIAASSPAKWSCSKRLPKRQARACEIRLNVASEPAMSSRSNGVTASSLQMAREGSTLDPIRWVAQFLADFTYADSEAAGRLRNPILLTFDIDSRSHPRLGEKTRPAPLVWDA